MKDLREYLDAAAAAVGDGEVEGVDVDEMNAALVVLRMDDDGEMYLGNMSDVEFNDHGEELALVIDAELGSKPEPDGLDRDLRQVVVTDWARAAFGDAQATSIPQRAVRLLEEAIEAYQAAGGERWMAVELVDFVFRRPPGELAQELGGVSVCLLVMASALGKTADAIERAEVERVTSKPIAEFTARNQAKNDAGFLHGDLVSGPPTVTLATRASMYADRIIIGDGYHEVPAGAARSDLAMAYVAGALGLPDPGNASDPAELIEHHYAAKKEGIIVTDPGSVTDRSGR